MRTIRNRLRSVLLLTGLAIGAAAQSPHSAPLRLPPTRASAPVKIGKEDYFPISAVERRWGLRGTWLKRDEKLLLQNERWKIEFDADSREVEINGLRLFLGEPCRVIKRMLYISKADADLILGPILTPGYLQAAVPDLRVIAIDPGHGGSDHGTQNPRLGLSEKTFTLDVSLRLARLLRADGYKVIMTRDSDVRLDLPVRSVTANTYGADLFLSIHFNSLLPDVKPSGSEFYTFPPVGIRSAEAWSAKKDDDTETTAAPINKFDHWNSVLAFAMQREVLAQLKTFDRGKKFKHLGVLRGVNCPGMLIEAGFLSNEAEGRKIATPEYRQQIAESIAKGVRSYAAVLSALRTPAAAGARSGK
ncbi:MAG: N-acetylmuramoyl-L-alanine amidase [Nibricoccus sp.]